MTFDEWYKRERDNLPLPHRTEFATHYEEMELAWNASRTAPEAARTLVEMNDARNASLDAKDAARYRKLRAQAVEGDWGALSGWKLHVDIKGAPSIENIDDAIDAQFRLPCGPQQQGGRPE